MLLWKRFCFLLALLSFYACTQQIRQPQTNPVEELREKISYLVSDPNLFNAQVGIYIESLKNGEVIFNQNEHKLFISASNMKLYTTAVSLLKFGPDFRFKTGVYLADTLDSGTLHGDLIVRGSGDVSISGHFHDGDATKPLNAWADTLIKMGITRITGNIVGDASYFQTPSLGPGWEWDDEYFSYAAQISALTINDNCINVTVRPNEVIGFPPYVELSPLNSYVTVENYAVTTAADSVSSLRLTRPRLKNTVVVSREIPVNNRKINELISVENPAQFFVELFAGVLAQKGIIVEGKPIVTHEPDAVKYQDYRLALEYLSPPLSEIITAVNKPSQNLYAEQLLVTLAAEYGLRPSSNEGTKLVSTYLADIGIPETEFRMQDGSGLSRKNLISPLSTASLLRYMARHDYFDYYYSTLPIGGVDGTLRRRMIGTSAVNNVRAKTGFVGYARNLSGYVTSREGEKFVFSVLVNNYTVPTSAVNILQDKICNLLSEFSRN